MTVKYIFLIGILAVSIFSGCEKKNNSENKIAINKQKNQSKQNLEYWKKNSTISNFINDSGNLGFWGLDSSNLPVFQYTGTLPAETFNLKREKVEYSEDPFFLMGNNMLTLFAHASGKYQLLTLERSIARLNRGKESNTGENFANIKINNDSYDLIGLDSKLAIDNQTEKVFGCGFAAYKYTINEDISVERILTTIPSQKVKDGCPVFRIQVKIKNRSSKKINFEYSEGLTARYDFLFQHNYKGLNIRTTYPVETSVDKNRNLIKASFKPNPNAPMVINKNKYEHSISESFPPSVYLQMDQSKQFESSLNFKNQDSLSTKISGTKNGTIGANSSVNLEYFIGYNLYEDTENWDKYIAMLSTEIQEDILLRKKWQNRLPDFIEEEDQLLRAEMIWNAYVLFSMTTWSEMYQDLYVPQGNLYEYALGVSATTSDNMMHVLPFNYLDTAFAKSMIRFGLKQTNFRGFTNPSNEGGYRIPQAPWIKSHTPLYYFMVVAEYLDLTKDASFLSEEIPFWGMQYSNKGTVLDRLERIFIYLRDEVYVGEHGLIRLLLSDWNDGFYFIFKDEDFFATFRKGESFANTTMALQYLPLLANSLEDVKDSPDLLSEKETIDEFIKGLRGYKNELMRAFIKEWGENQFVPRAYVGSGKKVGMDNLFLEPNAFVIGITEIPKEKRLAIWEEIKKRNWKDEALGARQSERSIGHGLEGVGSGENAGFWYSLNGPMINGLINLDTNEALNALNRIRFSNNAKNFPNYWVGMWSGPDTFDSSLSETQGLVRKWGRVFPVFCAHSHAWALWNYFEIKSKNLNN